MSTPFIEAGLESLDNPVSRVVLVAQAVAAVTENQAAQAVAAGLVVQEALGLTAQHFAVGCHLHVSRQWKG